MKKTILIGLLIASLWAPTAWSCNYPLLASESDTINSKLSSRLSVSQAMIQDSLHFLYNTDAIEEKYKQPTQFETLYMQTQGIADPYFSEFFNNCHALYQTPDSDLKTKASLHLLLEKVNQKYAAVIKLANRQKRLAEEERKGAIKTTQADADRIFLDFFDAAPTRVDVH